MSTNPIDLQPRPPGLPPQIFNPKRIALHQQRAARRRQRLKNPQFILAHIAEDMAQRISMINRQFEKALFICPSGFEILIKPHLNPDKRPKNLRFSSLQSLALNQHKKHKFDLIILVMAHHNENNPQGLLRRLKNHIIDDGHIITVCLGGETLGYLRQSLYAADQAFFGGIAARFHPLLDIQRHVQLLNHCGFNLTSGDRDRLTVHYKKFSTLISDIRDLGESHALIATSTPPLNRDYWNHVKTAYKSHFSDNEQYIAHYDVLWANGWMPHESQQKPLKPGSGKIHLSRAFKP